MLKTTPEKGSLSPTSSNSSLQGGSGLLVGGMRKNNSVGSLLNNLPSSFNFSSLTHGAGDRASQNLSRVDENHESLSMEGSNENVPTISVSSLSNSQPSDHRVNIGGTSYRTYPITQRGQPAWVAVLDQSEVHCIVPRVNHTLSLLSSAINSLADIEDKLVALSLL